jgi:hypothetical protein
MLSPKREQNASTADERTAELESTNVSQFGRHCQQQGTAVHYLLEHTVQEFLAHSCCQMLLADLWYGGLRIRHNSNLKVLLGLIFPPFIAFLEFKTKDELLLQPQTAAEHHAGACACTLSDEVYRKRSTRGADR